MSTKVDTLLIDPGTATTGQVLTYNATTARWSAQTPSSNVGDDCPLGSILFFAAPTPPRGWLVCDGSFLLTTSEKYADLFAVIGYTYGRTPGFFGSLFALPDLRGEFIRGWSDSRAGVDQPRVFGSNQSDMFKEHVHTYYETRTGRDTTSGGDTHYINAATDYTGPAGGSETRPRNVALLPCIKAEKTLAGTGEPLNFIAKPATATNGQILSYNSSGNTWIASNPPTGLPTTATGGQVLTYNGSTSTWVASASPAGARSTSSFTIDGSSLAKAWVTFNGKKDTSGADSTSNTNRLINGSYRVDSVLRTGQGQYTINFSTGTFESANYAYTVGVDSKATGVRLSQAVRFGSKTLSAFQIETDDDGTDDTDDLSEVCFTFYASGGNFTGTANVFDTTPVGTVTYFAASAAPVGYMICNGTVLSRAAYPELFTVIGTIYNTSGEGISNFRLPNLLGEFIRGWDNGRGVNTGRVFGSNESDEFKSHSHTIEGSMLLYGIVGGGSQVITNINNSSTVSTGGSETRPRNVALLPCIKVVRTVTGDTTIINYVEKPATATNGQVLSYNSTTGKWVATNNTASLPFGTTTGQVLTYNALTETWVASAAPASSNITAVTLAGTMVILQDQKPAGTSGGNSSSGSWTTRVLNTKVTDIGGLCTLANNQFTLLAGTYAIDASAPCYRGNNHRIRLFNVTDNSTTCYGTSEYAWNGSTSNVQTQSCIKHVFTIPSAKVFEIQHYITTGETSGLGVPLSQGTEIYTNVEITKSVALSSAAAPMLDTLPIGTVSWFAAAAVPTGYLECNGALVSKSTYSILFQVIGTRYNTGGEGLNNFRLPDLRGEFIRGWSNGKAGVDATRVLGSSQGAYAGFNKYISSIDDGDNSDNDADKRGEVAYLSVNDVPVAVGSERNTRQTSKTTTVDNQPGDTRPRNVALMPCIKAEVTMLGTTVLNYIDKPANPTNGQSLIYSETTGKWEAGGARGSVLAWVTFDGTRNSSGTIDSFMVVASDSNRLIKASNNVSSVRRHAAGDYTITFTTAMPDTNYIINGNGNRESATNLQDMPRFYPNCSTATGTFPTQPYVAPTLTTSRVLFGNITPSTNAFGSGTVGVDLPRCYVYFIR